MYSDSPNPLENLFASLRKVQQATSQLDHLVRARLPVSTLESFRTQCQQLDPASLPGYLQYFEELEMYEHCAVIKSLLPGLE
jgi:hypothetical protein